MRQTEVLLSTGEAARILRVRPERVKYLASQGRLRMHGRTVGGHRRFLERDVLALARKMRRSQ